LSELTHRKPLFYGNAVVMMKKVLWNGMVIFIENSILGLSLSSTYYLIV